MPARRPVAVVVEVGDGRAFASAVEWPGWCRGVRVRKAETADAQRLAVAELERYADRYARLAGRAGVAFSPGRLDVVEVVEGNATTSFGAPGVVAADDGRPTTAAQGRRLGALLAACWAALDEAAAAAPEVLRKGPRGGGRDRDEVLAHVMEAERSYARAVGVRIAAHPVDDAAAVAAHRSAVVEAVVRADDGIPKTPKGWPLRYFVRRASWHVTDHAWEIEDRAT